GKPEAATLAILARKSRDNSRSPMLWDSSDNAGSTRGGPWIGVADNYTQINAANALPDSNSVFYGYQTLLRLRKSY
ncbi:alpha,alpha-phosphotrehalase, partial [Pantoea dispersa]|nr:alpha,alpha-phosphotrehalase [Pantoea dispersa]